ncbi:MAG: hypothetical protein WD208_03135 [Dehalococcoidia bacterium]
MGLVSIRDGIVSSLEGIDGLRVYDHMPDNFSQFPSVAVRMWSANYTDATFTFRLLLAAAGWDERQAEKSLHAFLDSSGASSISTALNAEPGCTTVSAGPVGRQLLNGLPYLGAEITVIACDT